MSAVDELPPDAGERVAPRRFSEWDFAYLELRAKRAYLERRIAIAKVKMEHGLLTDWEQDDLALEMAELKEQIRLLEILPMTKREREILTDEEFAKELADALAAQAAEKSRSDDTKTNGNGADHSAKLDALVSTCASEIKLEHVEFN